MSHNDEYHTMASLKDERGFNQGFTLSQANQTRMQRRWDFIIEQVRDVTADASKMTVLELGCSHGHWTRYMVNELGCRCIGADISDLFVSVANSESADGGNPSFTCLDFLDEDTVLKRFEPQSLDAIVGNGVLHHFEPELDRALQLIHTLLKPGGRMVFIEPNLMNPYVFGIFSFAQFRRLASLEPNEMAFTRWNIKPRLMQAGFYETDVHCADFLLPDTPVWLIKPLTTIGTVFERTLLREIAQSVFIVAKKH